MLRGVCARRSELVDLLLRGFSHEFIATGTVTVVGRGVEHHLPVPATVLVMAGRTDDAPVFDVLSVDLDGGYQYGLHMRMDDEGRVRELHPQFPLPPWTAPGSASLGFKPDAPVDIFRLDEGDAVAVPASYASRPVLPSFERRGGFIVSFDDPSGGLDHVEVVLVLDHDQDAIVRLALQVRLVATDLQVDAAFTGQHRG